MAIRTFGVATLIMARLKMVLISQLELLDDEETISRKGRIFVIHKCICNDS